jgi:N-acetylglucosaminyl-diphospho-decaprenol L-rhamnosyltransferase
MPPGDATVIYVAFRTPSLDLSWIPTDGRVVVVHNDRSLDPASCAHPSVEHVLNDANVGFGAGVNRALPLVGTGRVILCNPDTVLNPAHWDALATGSVEEIVTLPLRQPDGRPTSVVNRYPTPLSLVLTGWGVGRLFPRGGRGRHVLAGLLGKWGRHHEALLHATSGRWPLSDYWVSAAVVSVDAGRLRAVGGFDEQYFLYLEDIDLCRRLAARFPGMMIRMDEVGPGEHKVGGSAHHAGHKRAVKSHYLDSARRYARAEPRTAWRLAELALAVRASLPLAR